jgi:hypothetical protein
MNWVTSKGPSIIDILWLGTLILPLLSVSLFFPTVRRKPGCAKTQQQGGDRGCYAQDTGKCLEVGMDVCGAGLQAA